MEAELKVAYQAPEVVNLGSFEDITAGSKGGEALDASYPVETPKSQLTFS